MTPPAVSAASSLACPSLGQIGGHLLDSIFVDTLESDLERMCSVNATVSLIPDKIRARHAIGLRNLQAFLVSPQRPLDELAAAHVHRLPPAIRVLLRAVGAMRDGRTNVLSYLLTEGWYCRSLMRRGFRDAMARRPGRQPAENQGGRDGSKARTRWQPRRRGGCCGNES